MHLLVKLVVRVNDDEVRIAVEEEFEQGEERAALDECVSALEGVRLVLEENSSLARAFFLLFFGSSFFRFLSLLLFFFCLVGLSCLRCLRGLRRWWGRFLRPCCVALD